MACSGQAVEQAMSIESGQSAGKPRGFSHDEHEQLSALVDGELEPTALTGLLSQWRDDEGARSRWHGYQLIGDVLRSEDLASTARHDLDFLASLRLKLAAEPVVLAPSPAPHSHLQSQSQAAQEIDPSKVTRLMPRRWSRWSASAAMAAGLAVLVVGTVNLMRPAAPSAELATAAPGNVPAPLQTSGLEPSVQVISGSLIRDARLDSYLAAHQQLSGGSMLGGHAAYVRRAAADMPAR
jgi:sigma-E factor negative regulatory protein RseA